MVSRIVLIFSLLLLSYGAFLAAPQALAQAGLASLAKTAKAPVPNISVSPTGVLADINGNSVDDLTLHYSIDGDLSQLNQAWIEITDGPHGKVLFTQPVPIQSSGEVIWARGQPMDPTPNEISFQVWNADNAISSRVRADSEYPLPDDNPTPILSSITPQFVVKGTKYASIILRGRNFIPNAMITFSRNGIDDEAKLKPQFISSHVLILAVPESLIAQEGSWEVEVLLNDWSNSEPLLLQVVPPGLPPAPTLTAISPNRIRLNEKPVDRWITLLGENFRRDDTRVISDGEPRELHSIFVSEHQMRALIPAWSLSGPWCVNIHLESTQHSELASRTVLVTILNRVGQHSATEPIEPFLRSVNDGYVALPASREASPITVRLFGCNFLPGSRVAADVDGNERTLKSVFVSSHELRAFVPAELWSRHTWFATLTIETKPAAAATIGKTLTAVASLR